MSYNLNQISAVLGVFHELEKTMPVSYAKVLVECAIWKLSTNEWPRMKDIEQRCGMSQSAFSRAVGALSDARQNERHGKPGAWPSMGLIEKYGDDADSRAKRLRVTPRGEDVLKEVLDIRRDKVKPVAVRSAA